MGTSWTTIFDYAAIACAIESTGAAITVDDVDTDDTIDEAQQNVAINGSGFGATQGTGGVTIDGVAQTVDTWSDTQITIDHAADLNKYGDQTLEVTIDGGGTAQRTITINPPAGTSFVDITNVDNSDIDSQPALEAGDQLRYDSTSTPNGYAITVDQNGQISVDAADPDGDTFTVAVWDPSTTDWGADATQTIDTGSADETAPTIQSATINTAGTELTIAFDEAVTFGADGANDVALSLSGGAVTATYTSGESTSSLVYSLSRTVGQSETGTLDYTQPGDGIQDTAGNVLASVSGQAVTNNSAADVVAPTIQSLTINAAGTQLTMALDENVQAGADGFDDLTLSLSGGAVTAAYVSGTGSSSLVYNLSRTVEQGETGTGDYTQPGDGIQDAAGNLLATDTGVTVTNNSTADVTAPTIQSLTVNTAGDQLTVALDENVVAGADGFNDLTLSLSGGAVTAAYSSGSGSSSLVYNLNRTVGVGETGTGDYTQPGDGIQDAAGNVLATVSGVAVTNNSTADVTAPLIQSVTISAAGDTATVAFSEAVVAGADGFNDLALNLSGGAVTATYDSGSGSTSLVYALNRVVFSDETGTADYTQPGDGIQDAAGNLLATIAGVTATNDSTVSSSGFIFSTAGLRLGFRF